MKKPADLQPNAADLRHPAEAHQQAQQMPTGHPLSEAESQTALRQQEHNFLKTLVQTLPDLIWLKDPAGVYLACNRRFEQLFGVCEADIVGKTDYDFVDQELADFFRKHDQAAIAAGKACINEEELTFANDGHRELLETIKTPMFDAEGRLLGVLGVARDITHARQNELALRTSEAMYRSLFDNMLNGFAYCRMLFENGQPQDFVFIFVNKAFETQSGLQDVVGRKVSEVIAGIRESDPHLFEIYGRVAAGGEPERLEIYINIMKMWFLVSVYSPHEEHFVLMFENITEGKQAELALRQQTEELRSRNAELYNRNEELQRFNRAMVGRELDMIALKQQVNALSRQLGQEPPYPLAFLNPGKQDTAGLEIGHDDTKSMH